MKMTRQVIKVKVKKIEKMDKGEDEEKESKKVVEDPIVKEEKKEDIVGDEEDKKEKKEAQEENKELLPKMEDKPNDNTELKKEEKGEDISKLSDKNAAGHHITSENVYQDILELEKVMEESSHKNIDNDPEPPVEVQTLTKTFDGKLTIVIHKATDVGNDGGKNKKRELQTKILLCTNNKESKELLKGKTKVGKSTNPVWDEFFETQVNFDGALRLELSVIDGWDFLGKATHVFETTHKFGEPVEIPLQPKKKKKSSVERLRFLFATIYPKKDPKDFPKIKLVFLVKGQQKRPKRRIKKRKTKKMQKRKKKTKKKTKQTKKEEFLEAKKKLQEKKRRKKRKKKKRKKRRKKMKKKRKEENLLLQAKGNRT